MSEIKLTKRKHLNPKLHFKVMSVGDTFTVENEFYFSINAFQSSVSGSASYFVRNQKPDWKFKTKKIGNSIKVERIK